MTDQPASVQSVRQWLQALARQGRPWDTLAMLAGILQGMAIIAQSALLAKLLHGLIMEGASLQALSTYWIALPLVFLLRALANWARDEAGSRASAKIRRQLRVRLLDATHRNGPAWRSAQAGGALASTLLEQIDALDAFYSRYRPQVILSGIIPLMILVAVFPRNWAAGLILLLTAPLIPLFMALVGMGAQARQRQQLQALNRMSGYFLDLVRGMQSLRLMNAHRRQIPKIADLAEEFRIRTMSVLRLAFLSSAVLEFFTSLAIAVSAVYLGFSFLGHLDFGHYGAPLTLETAFFVLLLAPEFYWPLRELGIHYHAKAEAQAAAEHLMPIDEHIRSAQQLGGTRPPPAGAPGIALRTVSFAHVAAVPVLRELDLEIGRAEAVAIVGASGAGKTTLLRLILGQLAATEGEIRIDGDPLAELDLQAWRERIGWMSQHPRLMSASLADNLRVARLDADDVQLIASLEFAGLSGWFAALPQGLDTRLGEGGRQLSGGQLRRLALARVWLRDAPLLLLDEPTASLDHETEAVIMAGLAKLRQGRTVVMLTHRSAPLQLVDRVALLEGGRIVESAADYRNGRIGAFLAGVSE
ncbi:ATP-binding cassette, subfamily C, CydD [Formivibrio citricus]|uniref:ATP-binding cassette, subfamily C, CydD n=1 Tax=Formivibrio citricus TaxID=83765 RepID=A0A1I4VSW9_9NEIS|nr:thiol reductant ABC exporter subunit CydD [Formivibrio citricus]SFN04290.1 ATP-binding cassette, subfamily C, CydD [Formivibrio citricus]